MVKMTNAERARHGVITKDPWPSLNASTQRYARAAMAMVDVSRQAEEAEQEAHDHYTAGRYHIAAGRFAAAAAHYRDLADQLSKASAALFDGPRTEPAH